MSTKGVEMTNRKKPNFDDDSDEDDIQAIRVYSLCMAASKNNARMIRKIVAKHNVDVSASDYDKRAALHLAAADGALEAAEALIELKADINAQDRFGQSPLDEAVTGGHEKVAALLRKHQAVHHSLSSLNTKFLNAVSERDVEKVTKFIKNGLDVNCADYDKRTALHIIVDKRDIDLLTLLLDNGADGNFKDVFGVSPYEYACKNKTRSGVDSIREAFEARGYSQAVAKGHEHGGLSTLVKVFGPIQILMLILMFAWGEYHVEDEADEFHNNSSFNYLGDTYGWFMDVHVMIFIGFGFLMTFLRKYQFGAVGLTFYIGAFALQLHMIVECIMGEIMMGHGYLELNVKALVLGDFAAGAVLITYGVLLGKATPLQMMVLTVIEIFVYTINELIGLQMGITDIGGSMVIHMFGAFFGLSCSWAMQSQWAKAGLSADNSSVYHSDVFAMIGTIFLWMFWPSFNAVLGANDELRHMAVANTVLSLAGSCTFAFLASNYLRGEKKFCMVDVQNATLAGGVAMGTSADMACGPGAAVLIGSIAGVVSVWGYTSVQPWLQHTIGLHDTCGVHNLHGMPSIIGAVAGIIVLASQTDPGFSVENQVAYLFITLAISIFGGLITGWIVKNVDDPEAFGLFLDEASWEVPGTETPYYFDSRGEVQHSSTEDDPMLALKRDITILSNRMQTLESAEAKKDKFNRRTLQAADMGLY
jgi:ammonium transporter Rh